MVRQLLLIPCSLAVLLCLQLDSSDAIPSPAPAANQSGLAAPIKEFAGPEAAAYINYTEAGQSDKCVRLMHKSDSCVKEVLFMGKSAKDVMVPRSEKEIDYYCDQLRSHMDCLFEYRTCLKLVPKTLYGIMARDAKKTLKQICMNPAAKKQALDHLKCFSDENFNLYYRMLNGYTNVVMHLSKTPEPELPQLIGSACCAFHALYKNGYDMISHVCDGVTGKATGQFVGGLVRSFATSAIDVVCGKHSSVEVCNQLMPKQMQAFEQQVKEGQGMRFPFSPVTPLVKILNIMDSSTSL